MTTARELVAARKAQAPAVTTDNRDYRSRYIDEQAPASTVGRLVKFSKDGEHITVDDGKAISDADEFVALVPETLVGLIKFNGPGEPPSREMGLLYDGFEVPSRESLGDLDQSKWEKGLDGQPQDPWLHQQCLVLQHTGTDELFTWVTTSRTGRRAVGNLLRHYDRMQRTSPNDLPVVRLGRGGFQHRDSRVGFVPTPVFVVVGRHNANNVAKPPVMLDDAVPF
jgi:hypothetical protein